MHVRTNHDHIIACEYLPESPLIVDGGACIGEFSKFLVDAGLVQKSDIWLIEANSENVDILKKNFINVTHAILCGDDLKDEEEFNIYNSIEWGTIFRIDRGRPFIKSEKVGTIRINSIFDCLEIDRIDYMKLDIEGAEYNLFDTMTIETAEKIGQISCEVHPLFAQESNIESNCLRLGFSYSWFSNNELFMLRKDNICNLYNQT